MGHSISSLSQGGVAGAEGHRTAETAATTVAVTGAKEIQPAAVTTTGSEQSGTGKPAGEPEEAAEPGEQEPGVPASDEGEQQQEEEEEEEVASEAGDMVSELPVLDVPEKFRDRKRRFSVSAEADHEPGDAEPPVKIVPKSAETRRRLESDCEKCILFQGIDEEQKRVIFNAMEEVRPTAGETVIRQGAEGDYFYVIDSGKFEVFHRTNPDAPETKIWSYDGAGSFGELALMYNSPRAATVRAVSDGVLWRLDRQTFRAVLVGHNARQRKRYEEFLSRVPLFANLSPAQRSSFADVLIPTFYESGRRVVFEGEHGDMFFIVEKGRARVTVQKEVDGKMQDVEIDRIEEGGCFGERALITDEPRSATVWADGDLKVAAMGRSAYQRLIGQVYIN